MDPRTEQMLAERQQKAASIPASLRGPARTLDNVKFWARTHGFVVKAAAAGAVVVMFVAYYVFVAMPAKRAEDSVVAAQTAEQIRTGTEARQIAIDECLSKAAAEAEARWKATCKARREGAGCALSARVTEELQRQEGAARNTCLMRFSVATQ